MLLLQLLFYAIQNKLDYDTFEALTSLTIVQVGNINSILATVSIDNIFLFIYIHRSKHDI